MKARVAVVRFPGSNCDLDTIHVLRNVVGLEADLVWHSDRIGQYDAVILPGGFSYGDRLRAGAIAAHSPVMNDVKRMAEDGLPVLGICNGFQILAEAGLLPGSLLRNSGLKFVCRWTRLKMENVSTIFTASCRPGDFLRMPVAHGEGRYFMEKEELQELRDRGQVAFTYVDEEGNRSAEANPNGSEENIAGVCNREGNVLGMMPHPERASEAILNPFGTEDGRLIFGSLERFLRVRA